MKPYLKWCFIDSQLRLRGNTKGKMMWCFNCWSWPYVSVLPGYDVAGPVAIGLTRWKNPYAQGRPTLPSDLPLFISKDAGVPVYHRSLTRKTELATPLSCPASLSITPVPSYSSSSQETLSQDTTGNGGGFLLESQDTVFKEPFTHLPTEDCICISACGPHQFSRICWPLNSLGVSEVRLDVFRNIWPKH